MRIHRIKVDFQVTPQVKRYVYVYLVEGESCYLIDSGTAGCQRLIEKKMKQLGRNISEIRGIFLTHSHPDHIGTAAWFREQTGCRIYAPKGERAYIEDIDLQYAYRPIPNFYMLAGKSVPVDTAVQDGDKIELDEPFSVQVIGTAGHSADGVSYQIENALFVGDSIPVKGEIPIYIDAEKSLQSLERIRERRDCTQFYPAWDHTYGRAEITDKLDAAKKIIESLGEAVSEAKKATERPEEIAEIVCEKLQMSGLQQNPLFVRTINSHLRKKTRIVVLAGSPRRNGNTDRLVRAFCDGAKENHEIDILSAADYTVYPCIGCNSCFEREDHTCFRKDDMQMICSKLAGADILVIASPIYFYGISAQLKGVIDRLHTPLRSSFHIRKLCLLLTAASENPAVFDAVRLQYRMILDYFGLENAGMVLAGGVQKKGDIEGKPVLEEARHLGKTI